jgi:hypothetical protein
MSPVRRSGPQAGLLLRQAPTDGAANHTLSAPRHRTRRHRPAQPAAGERPAPQAPSPSRSPSPSPSAAPFAVIDCPDVLELALYLGLHPINRPPVCHSYQHGCLCQECSTRAANPSRRSQHARQPWQQAA